MLQNLRRSTQAFFLLLFFWLFLQTESKGANELGYPVKIFLDADPLLFLTTFLATWSPERFPYLALIVAVATVILGRGFCGWVCPLGTLNNMAGALKRWRLKTPPLNWHRVKYIILIFLLVSSLFSLQLTGIVDPLALLIRSLSIALYPMFSYGTGAAFDAVYSSNIPVVVTISEFFYSIMKKTLLPFQLPFFLQATFIGVLFFLILGANLLERRFWCKYLCPLGALLGILSRYALLKRSVSEGCDSCGACTATCQGGAVSDQREGWNISECLVCGNCDDLCPRNAVSFGFSTKKPAGSLDLGRRRVTGSIIAGIIAPPLFRISPLTKPAFAYEKLIRPPGAVDEKEFLRKCVKCGECMKVCITNGLQPTFLEAGFEGIWSPVLVPRIGYCEYRCTLCGQVCPTGAIKKLDLAEKEKVKIGLAMVDRGRCLPYSHATPCVVCEEVCPTPKKAIWLETVEVKDREGKELTLKQPKVDLELCIGCGICEAKCPVIGQPAIYVTSVGESRSKEKQLLLP